MKCKKCDFEETLNKREAMKNWKDYNKKMRTLSNLKLITLLFVNCIIGGAEIFWMRLATALPANDANQWFIILHGLVALFILVLFTIYWLDKLSEKWDGRMKNKFTKKFPDDAKYLD